MELIRLSTQETIALKELKEIYRNVLFPSDLANANLSDYDAAVVFTDPAPAYDPETQTLELSAPQLIEGVWRRTWSAQARQIDTITMRQCRLELLARGLLGAVNQQVALLPEAAQIEWEYATQVNRNSQFVGQLAALLGFDETTLDQFFLEASQR